MRFLSCFPTVLLSFSMLALSSPVLAEETDSFSREMTDIYFFNSGITGEVETVFFTEDKDIPYISVCNAAVLLNDIAGFLGDTDYAISESFTTYGEMEENGLISLEASDLRDVPVYLIQRENGAFVFFDATTDTITISDRDKFVAKSYAVSGGDLVYSDGLYYQSEDTILWDTERDQAVVNLFKRANANLFVREGEIQIIELENYGIEYAVLDDIMYLPLATISDLILPVTMTYNGKNLFVTGNQLEDTFVNDDQKTLYDLYYEPEERERSQALAIFNYNELCLMLDECYGLADEHRIEEGFHKFFQDAELTPKLYSTDNEVYTEALYQLLDGYLGDLHSALNYCTPYAGESIDTDQNNISISLIEDSARIQRFEDAREAAGITEDGEIIEGYTEIGDTAFITFDSFKGATMDYYDEELWSSFNELYMNDTISLVVWAHNRIHRENSPIRKVVIDLSLNGGGELDACVYIASWVLGEVDLSLENIKTGAQYTTSYWVDTNLDGICSNEDDLGIGDLEVYCLISGNSFSCGNLLPSLFKQDGRVTLVGQASGGGACVVRHVSAADGTLFQISDLYRLSIVKNGSFYSIDRGVEPDIPLRKCESFYDREALVDYLETFR